MWDLNLGKLCYLVPVNRSPYPTSLNTHREDPSMAYSSAIPRQLAPTVGLAALAGVNIRTGNLIGTGERVISGLVQRFGVLDFVSNNAGCFGTRPLPRNGLFVKLGAHKVYVAVDVSCVHPCRIIDAGEPPLTVARGARIARPRTMRR